MTEKEFAKKWPRLAKWFDPDQYSLVEEDIREDLADQSKEDLSKLVKAEIRTLKKKLVASCAQTGACSLFARALKRRAKLLKIEERRKNIQ